MNQTLPILSRQSMLRKWQVWLFCVTLNSGFDLLAKDGKGDMLFPAVEGPIDRLSTWH